MSYIYEALKRAEDENARGSTAAPRVRRRRFFVPTSRTWLWALVVVLGANAVVLVTLAVVRRPHPPSGASVATTDSDPPIARPPDARAVPLAPPASTTVVAAAPATPPAAEAPRIVPSPATEGPVRSMRPTVEAPRKASPAETPTAGRTASATAGGSARAVTAPAKPTAPPPARQAPDARVERAPAPAAAAAVPEPVAARPEAPVPGAPVVAPPAAPPIVAPPPAPPATAPSPAPPKAADGPKLQVQVVVYSEVPAERMVIIDGRRYTEGQKIDADTMVESITPEGAIVSRQGQRLTLTTGRP